MALAQTNNIVSDPVSFKDANFHNSKLFAWTGKHEEHDMFIVSTNITYNSKLNHWAGLRLDFTNSTNNIRR